MGDQPLDDATIADAENDVLLLDNEADEQGHGDDDVEISFEGEAAPEPGSDSGLVKHLRNQLRDSQRRNADLTRAVPKVEAGPKPDLWEDCEGDADKYDAAIDAWKDRKTAADTQAQTIQDSDTKRQTDYNGDLEVYRVKKAAMARPDFDDAEGNVTSSLSNQMQALIVTGADDPAKVIYAIGKSPAKLAELAEITNPIKFLAAIIKLESKITMTSKRRPADPERVVSGSASLTTSKDTHLAKLEKLADASGNRTDVIAYRRKMRDA